jgi:hypothetical protein
MFFSPLAWGFPIVPSRQVSSPVPLLSRPSWCSLTGSAPLLRRSIDRSMSEAYIRFKVALGLFRADHPRIGSFELKVNFDIELWIVSRL